jgi:hypothetical protein
MKTMLTVVPFSGTYGNSYFDLDWRDDAVEFDEPFKTVLEDFAKQYVPAWNEEFKYVTGIDLHLEYDSVELQREYNFSTDRIFAKMPFKALREMVKSLRGEDGTYPELDAVCKERHTSYEGFYSFYESDWNTWGPMREWDHNQIETVILACLMREGSDSYAIEREVMDVSSVREAVENHIVYAEEEDEA